MPLHPQVEALLKQLEAAPEPAPSSLPPVEARPLARANALRYAAPPEPVAAVRRLDIDGPAGSIPARLYRPAGEGPFPLLLFFHGGGFLFGGLDEVDDAVRHLAARTPCLALSVDYRLAPEHPYPAASDDCEAAALWLISSMGHDIPRQFLAIGGESSTDDDLPRLVVPDGDGGRAVKRVRKIECRSLASGVDPTDLE